MNARPVDTTQNHGQDRTAESAEIKTTGARIKIPIDRLPPAPEPTLPIRAWRRVDTFAGIEHEYRVRKAVKKKNVRKERER